jgi:hypothetical protein
LRRRVDGPADAFGGVAGEMSGLDTAEIQVMNFLDALDARTIVVLGLILPVLVTALLFFFARGFFRRFWILILLLAGAMEWFLIVQVGPLFL